MTDLSVDVAADGRDATNSCPIEDQKRDTKIQKGAKLTYLIF